MPSIPDWSREDEDLPSIGGPPGGGGLQSFAAPSASPTTPTRGGGSGATSGESGFVPWERFVSANKGVSDREAGKLQAGVQGSINAAEQGRDSAIDAQTAGIESNYAQKPVKEGTEAAAPSAFGGSSAFGAAEPQADGASAVQMPASGDVLQSKREVQTNKDTAQGAQSLEQQMGSDSWLGLIGDTMKATNEAKALGSEGGVEALIKQGNQSPNSAFDAALISGAGGEDFRRLSQEYGGNRLSSELAGANQGAMDRWSSLMTDIERKGLAQDSEAVAATQAAAQGDTTVAQKGIQDHLAYLNQNFPTLGMAKDKDTLLAWMNANSRGTGAEHSQQASWANSIYGPDVTKQLGTQGAVTKLYQDIQKMTPEEFAMFAQGFIPPWMGLGDKAMGINGGFWWGFRNSNNQVGAGGPGDPSKLSPEKRQEYETAMKALGVFYQALAAVATGAAYAAGGPLAGAAVGAATQAGIQGQAQATGAGK